MCLDTRRGMKVLKKDTTVYKVVAHTYDTNGYIFLRPLFFPTGIVFKHGENRAKVTPVTYYTSKGFKSYPSGYHCFLTHEHAVIYKRFNMAYDADIVAFTIPAGTEVYTGYTNISISKKRLNLYTLVSPVIILK